MRWPMRARRWRASSPTPPRSRNCSRRLTETFALPRAPRRIEVYDNSHIGGTNAVGAMVVAGPEGFRKNQYRKFNIRSADLAPGDDYGMMREVLQRRFKRLLEETRENCARTSRKLHLPPPLWGRSAPKAPGGGWMRPRHKNYPPP